MSVQILIGDVRDQLKGLPDESVHCVVTSPPYWGLRDYGIDGQLGLEPSLGEHVATMVDVFREVRRVLRKDGTLWLNYGDSYATSVNGRSADDTKAVGNDDRTFRDKPFSTIGPIFRPGNSDKNGGRSNRNGLSVDSGSMLKPKDLCGVPWRVAFALQDDGWWLRQDIIWSKPNPMPESIRDRCTKSHEYLFLMARSERYFYDADAIKEESVTNDPRRPYGSEGSWELDGRPIEARPNGKLRKRSDPVGGASHKQRGQHSVGGVVSEYTHRNRRSVWTINTDPFAEAHFATFPPALIEPCIKAGCPAGGTVLDPFGGAGTTGLVADRLRRNAILIELNPKYAAMARRRIDGDSPLFAGTEHEPEYDGQKDLAGSIAEGFKAIRDRVAAGGPGWTPGEPK